jgi:hypothetical protein
VTDAFRWGRAFLLGDAAHIHSPAGGQGMNTGIGDGFNLGWKLAHVLRGGPDALLDTYAMERHAFAEQLVATTDRIFMAVVGKSTMSRIIRLWVFPRLLPLLMQFNKFRHFAFVTISQLVVQYRDSALSTGGDAGERLPWTGNNFAPLRSFDWQVHVYGQLLPGLQTFCDSRALPVVVFPAHKAMKRDVIYLVRPDGYVGFEGQDLAALDAYCTKWHIDQA